jgi:hypothetical protein
MIVTSNFINHWSHKGHELGSCFVSGDNNLIYVNIPKCASSWTKSNLESVGWQLTNYHLKKMHQTHALVVLRDPIERWLSGICEYFTLYHKDVDINQFNNAFYELLLDRITFDDHTEKQRYFIEGLDTDNCTFFKCDSTYRTNFSHYLSKLGINNHFDTYNYTNVGDQKPIRAKFKNAFNHILTNPDYVNRLKTYFREDYYLIDQVPFYDPR